MTGKHAMSARFCCHNVKANPSVEIVAEAGLSDERAERYWSSREAILQLKPNNADGGIKNSIPEGYIFRPFLPGAPSSYRFTDDFLNSFEANVKRKTTWMMEEAGSFTPYKYTVGPTDAAQYAPQPQYYMVMRLAELYLIRAEASLLLSETNKDAAISDLNVLR